MNPIPVHERAGWSSDRGGLGEAQERGRYRRGNPEQTPTSSIPATALGSQATPVVLNGLVCRSIVIVLVWPAGYYLWLNSRSPAANDRVSEDVGGLG